MTRKTEPGQKLALLTFFRQKLPAVIIADVMKALDGMDLPEDRLPALLWLIANPTHHPKLTELAPVLKVCYASQVLTILNRNWCLTSVGLRVLTDRVTKETSKDSSIWTSEKIARSLTQLKPAETLPPDATRISERAHQIVLRFMHTLRALAYLEHVISAEDPSSQAMQPCAYPAQFVFLTYLRDYHQILARWKTLQSNEALLAQLQADPESDRIKPILLAVACSAAAVDDPATFAQCSRYLSSLPSPENSNQTMLSWVVGVVKPLSESKSPEPHEMMHCKRLLTWVIQHGHFKESQLKLLVLLTFAINLTKASHKGKIFSQILTHLPTLESLTDPADARESQALAEISLAFYRLHIKPHEEPEPPRQASRTESSVAGAAAPPVARDAA